MNHVRLSTLANLSLGAGLALSFNTASAQAPTAAASQEFEDVEIIVEKNATDGNAEIDFEVASTEEGLRTFTVRNPDGRVIIDLDSADGETLGMEELTFESPGPDGDSILDGYPEGWYTFRGVSNDGKIFRSRAQLSHQLPGAPRIQSPSANSSIKANQGFTIQWTPAAQIEGYVISVDDDDDNEDEDTNRAFEVEVPASQTSLVVPGGWLQRNAKYQLSVTAEGRNGNKVVSELNFSTN